MSRQSKKESRALRRRQDAAFRLLALGLLFVLPPLLFSRSPFVIALKYLAPFGWLLLFVGGGLAWLARGTLPRTPASSGLRTSPSSAELAKRASGAASPPDRVAIEIDRMLDKRAVPMPAKATHYAARVQLSRWTAEVFDMIEWRRFEAVAETLFTQVGFKTKTQSHGPDDGVDVWLYPHFIRTS